MTEYNYMHDPNEEIEELMVGRQPWEVKADVRFSKNGMVQFINDMFDREDPAKDELW